MSDHFTIKAKELGRRGVRLVKVDAGDDRALGNLISAADIVIAATNDSRLNRMIARAARARGVMIGSVDHPSESDFNFPAVRQVGDIRIGVTTGGRSPAMARLICRRLVRSITAEDRLWVELMNHARNHAKGKLPTAAARRAAVYRILKDAKVTQLLRARRLTEAEARAEAIIGET